VHAKLQLCDLVDSAMLIVHEEGDIQTRRRWIRTYGSREEMGLDVEGWGWSFSHSCDHPQLSAWI
jgi:hypothetical protein